VGSEADESQVVPARHGVRKNSALADVLDLAHDLACPGIEHGQESLCPEVDELAVEASDAVVRLRADSNPLDERAVRSVDDEETAVVARVPPASRDENSLPVERDGGAVAARVVRFSQTTFSASRSKQPSLRLVVEKYAQCVFALAVKPRRPSVKIGTSMRRTKRWPASISKIRIPFPERPSCCAPSGMLT
jgi:hypothetical protein